MARRQVSDNPIPEDYRELLGNEAEDPAFIAAWEHAAALNNSPKACMLYAQVHAGEYRADGEKSTEQLQEEIDKLTAQVAAREREALEDAT